MQTMSRKRILVTAINSAVAKVVNRQSASCSSSSQITQAINVSGSGNTVSGNRMTINYDVMLDCMSKASTSTDLSDAIMSDIKAELTNKEKGILAGLNFGSTRAEIALKNEVEKNITNENIVRCIRNSTLSQTISVSGNQNIVSGNDFDAAVKTAISCIANSVANSNTVTQIANEMDAVLENELDATLLDFGFGELGTIAAIVIIAIIFIIVMPSGGGGDEPPFMYGRPMYREPMYYN